MPNGPSWKLRTRTRYSAHTVWDYLTDPPVTSDSEVPWRVEAITPGWLTSRLCREQPDARVERLRVHSRGDMGSTVHRWIDVEYNEAGAVAGLPCSLFAKSTPSILTRLASGGRVVTQEWLFFSTIRDELPIRTPKMLASAIDAESGRSIQIFDDLVATERADFFGADTVVDRHYAEQMVDTLAGFHAALWDSPRFGTDLASLPCHGTFLRVGERIGTRAAHDQAMIKAKGVVPARIFDQRELIWPAAVDSMALHEAAPRTLLHADVHLGNWYASGDRRIGLADWQNTCTGNWAFDFAYTVGTTLSVEDRRAWESSLLQRYVDRVGHGLEFKSAWDSYRRALAAPLLLWTPTLLTSPVYPSMQSDKMSLLMIGRIATAMDDLDSLAAGSLA